MKTTHVYFGSGEISAGIVRKAKKSDNTIYKYIFKNEAGSIHFNSGRDSWIKGVLFKLAKPI